MFCIFVDFAHSNGFLRGAAEVFRFSKALLRYRRPVPGVFYCSLFQRSSSSSVACEAIKVIEDPSFLVSLGPF